MAQIKGLRQEELPREKLMHLGPESLTEVELLAILLRTGTKEKNVLELSREVLEKFTVEQVSRKMFEELLEFKGIYSAKACQIVAAFEFVRRLSSKTPEKKIRLTSAKQIFDLVKLELQNLNQERTLVLFVNVRNQLIKKEVMHEGSLDYALVEPRKIIKKALDYHATGFFLVHNHPSGDATPSREDVVITQRLKEAADLFDINFLDHVIVGERFFSFFDQNLM